MKGFLWCPHCGQPHTLTVVSCPKTGAPLTRCGDQRARALASGSVIARRYKVRAAIGDESVARLYDAERLDLPRRVIIKHVRDDGVARDDRDAEASEMEHEARVASLVDHPNVATVLDFGRPAADEAFLVRETSSRTRLSSVLRAAGALTAEDASDVVMQILSGLDALDQAGIVHRDLGSHNVLLLQRTGCRPLPRIAGLGHCSARPLGKPAELRSAVHYSSPEVLLGAAIDHRSDIFSCGVLLFEMLTGRRPFEAATVAEVRAAILIGELPAAARTLCSRLSAAWVDLLTTALHPDPERRFQTAFEFQSALPDQALPSRHSHKVAPDAEAAQRSLAATNLAATNTDTEPPPSRAAFIGGPRCDRFIGRRVANRYEIESLRGSGSAGAVYKATHLGLQRPVAVKVLHEWNRASEQVVGRFKSEALAASKLDHRNITRILDCGEESDATLYLVMEYVEGRTLEAEISARGRFSEDRAVRVALQILAALCVAHEAGIIHRDVKPENIILREVRDDDGRSCDLVKVCDFGLAKLHDRGDDARELTTQGLILGSPNYMAPEQIRAEPADQRSDTYAAGVTLFEMLTGRLPYEADSMTTLFAKKLSDPPSRLSSIIPDIDPRLDEVVMRALASDANGRHGSAAELRAELGQVLTQLRPVQQPTGRPITFRPAAPRAVTPGRDGGPR
jgi:serine/threonine protein kinase